MLSWTSGVAHFDQIRKENIRDRYEVAAIVKKLREREKVYFLRVLRYISADQSTTDTLSVYTIKE